MKSTGITRKIDELGRIVLPIELRKKMGIDQKDPMEIYVDGDMIILKKATEECILCGGKNNLKKHNDKLVCADCVAALSK